MIKGSDGDGSLSVAGFEDGDGGSGGDSGNDG